MIKPHHKPCFYVCLLSGIAIWLTLEGKDFWVCMIFVAGAFLYALIAISKYPDDKYKKAEDCGDVTYTFDNVEDLFKHLDSLKDDDKRKEWESE